MVVRYWALQPFCGDDSSKPLQTYRSVSYLVFPRKLLAHRLRSQKSMSYFYFPLSSKHGCWCNIAGHVMGSTWPSLLEYLELALAANFWLHHTMHNIAHGLLPDFSAGRVHISFRNRGFKSKFFTNKREKKKKCSLPFKIKAVCAITLKKLWLNWDARVL